MAVTAGASGTEATGTSTETETTLTVTSSMAGTGDCRGARTPGQGAAELRLPARRVENTPATLRGVAEFGGGEHPWQRPEHPEVAGFLA